MRSVCLAYKPYVRIRTNVLSVLKKIFVPHRIPAYATVLKRVQPMPNVPLAYFSQHLPQDRSYGRAGGPPKNYGEMESKSNI